MSGSIDEPWNPPQDQPQRALPYVGQPRAPQAPSAPPVFRTLPGFEEQPPENNGGGLWDSFGAQFWHDLKEKGSNAVEAGSLMARKLTGNPQIVQYIEGLRHGIDQNIQHQVDNMSPQEQATLRSSLFDPNAPRPGEVGWRNYIGSSLGSLAATLSLFLPAAAASIAAPELAPALAAGMFGTDQMGGAYKKVVDTLDNTPHKQMMANPAYAQRFTELTQQGLTQDQADIRAKQDLAGNVGVLMMGQFALGAAQGVVPGGMLLKGIFGKGLASLGGRLALGSLEGGGVMGGFGAASNALEQAANIQAGPQTQFDPQKLALAAASGFTGGALLGAASGAAHGKAERRETEREETEGTSERPPTTDGQVATDTKQALQEQLQTQPQAAPAAIESGTSPQQPAQAAPTPAAPPAQPATSAGMSRKQIIQALSGRPQVNPKELRRMNLTGLRQLYDGLQKLPEQTAQAAPATPGRVTPTTEQPVDNSSSPVLPERQESPTSKVDQAAAQAIEPTPAQAEAGNYQKGHLRLQGLDVTIETPKGGIRRGPIDQATRQPQWEATMPAHYGYIRGTRGADGDQVDVTLGPRTGALFNGTPEQAAREPVFVVDQIDPRTQKFDEHKALIGFHTPLEAQRAYDESFSDGSGPQRRRAVNEMTFDQFRDWLNKGDTTKPIGKRPRRSVATTKPAEPNAAPDVGRPVEQPAKPAEPLPVPEQPANEPLPSQTSHTEGANQTKNKPPTAPPAAVERIAAAEREIAADKEKESQAERSAAAQQRLQEALAASVHKLPKGTDATPYINRMLRELAESIGDTDGSPEEIGGALREWAKGKPREFADSVLNLMTGEKLGEHKLTDEQIEQGKRQIGTERATRTPVEALADKEGTGVVDYGAEKKRSEKTTNLDRKLKDLTDDIRQGLKTPAEAAQEYGEHPKGAEHTRNVKAWLKHMLEEERAKPPEEQDPDEIGFLAKSLRKLGVETGERKTTGPSEADRKAAIERLKRAQKRDMAKDEANSAEVKQEDEEPKALGLRRTYTRAARDLHLEDTVRDILMRDHAAGKSSSIHTYLDAIINSKGINYRLPGVAEFARRLKEMLHGRVVPTMSPETADLLYQSGGEYAVGVYENLGTYRPAVAARPETEWDEGHPGFGEHIQLNTRAKGGLLETTIHEALHSVTYKYIEDLPVTHPQFQALVAIREELRRAFEGAEGLTDNEKGDIDYAINGDRADPNSWKHELHTMLTTSPVVKQFAAEHISSAKFKVKMIRLGYLPDETKTPWKAFMGFVRRAVGLGKEHESLLDWAMRPLTDIIDKAHEENVREGRVAPVLPTDPALRQAAEPVGDLLRPLARPMRDFTDELPKETLRRLDLGGKMDSARRVLLRGATSDGIVRWNAPLFESRDKTAPGNSLRDYHAAKEAIAKASKDFRDAHQDTIHDTFDKLRKAPDRDKVAKLLIDSTLNETDASDKESKLHGEFGRLSAEGKAAFTGMRDVMNRMGKEERDAQWESMVRRVMPNATPEQIKAVRAIGKDQDELTEFLKNIDDNEVAKKFGTKWDAARDIVKGIAKIHSRGFVKGLYFPLRRFGDYVVRYGEKGEDNYGVEMFERRSEADARRNELLQQKGLNVSQVMDKREKKMQSMIPGGLPQELEMALNKDPALAKHADDVREMLSSIILQHEARSDLAKSRLQRKGIAGASQDIERVVSRNFLAMASRIGYLKHGFDRDEAHAAMLRHADWLGEHGHAREQIRASQVIKEMESRQASGDDASGFLTGLARRASTLGFVQNLMSFSHLLTSTLEAHMNSTSLLTARHGFKANMALTRALMHLAPTMTGASARGALKAVRSGLRAADWNMSTLMRDRLIAKGADRQSMIDLFNRLNAAGLIDHSMIREMQRIAYPGGFSGRTGEVWQRFMDFNAISAHAVDVMNKSAIAKAAYDLELAKTHDHEKALNYAVETARTAMPNYNLQNKNRLSRGLLSPLMQFKQYGFHMYTVMANLAHEAIANGDKEAAKAFAGILATHALIAGSFTLIADPLRYIMGVYDWISGAKAPHDYQADARGWLSDVAGPTVGEMIARGLPYAAGMDIHRRVGLANLLEVPELKSFTSAGFLDVAAQAMTGASGQDAIAMVDGLTKLIHGDMRGLLALVPRVFRDPIKAGLVIPGMGLAQQGVTDSRGRTILPSDQLTAADEALQAVGFQPSRVSEFREGRYAVMQARDEAKDARSQVIQAWVQAGHDADAREEAMEMMRRYNRDHPENRLQVSQLLQAAHRARNAARRGGPGSFGLTLPKKGARQLEEAGRFANM